MRFISDIGRPWTIREMQDAFNMLHSGDKISDIALTLNRSVKEIRVVLV
jgi:hypothetical protein